MTFRPARLALLLASLLALAVVGCDGGTSTPTDAGPQPDVYVPPGADASLDAAMAMSVGSMAPNS